jgi:[protein-PII] uridylyltransferase
MAIASPVEPRTHHDRVALPDAVAHPLDWEFHDRRLRKHPTDVATYSDCLAATRRTLEAGFRSGVSVVELVHGRAAIIDRLLALAWDGFDLAAQPELALVAVGGYGRGELHPGSDVDLLLLHGSEFSEDNGERIGRFLTFLWDIGLEVGHSVRSPGRLRRPGAPGRHRHATNLVEARLLAGDQDLFETMGRVTAPDCIWTSQAFFAAKLSEQKARHAKFHDTAYKLEPNIKESPGGLRDIHMVGWVAKRHFGAEPARTGGTRLFSPARIPGPGAGTDLPLAGALRPAHADRAARGPPAVRLPAPTGQPTGLHGPASTLGVEQFMQQYFRTVHGAATASTKCCCSCSAR